MTGKKKLLTSLLIDENGDWNKNNCFVLWYENVFVRNRLPTGLRNRYCEWFMQSFPFLLVYPYYKLFKEKKWLNELKMRLKP